MKIVVAGGVDFAAAALCSVLRREFDARVVYLGRDGAPEASDAFTGVSTSPRFSSFDLESCDVATLTDILRFEQPDAMIEFAGGELQRTEVCLTSATAYWSELAKARKASFRYVHAWPGADANAHGYGDGEAILAECVAASGIPALSARCAESLGPFQSPLALAPFWMTNAILDRDLPLAGLGLRQELYITVDDLARGLIAAATAGAPGSRYALEPNLPTSDLALLHKLCEILDEKSPRLGGLPHASAIVFDGEPRAGSGYSASTVALPAPNGWQAQHSLDEALAMLVDWHLEHASWWMPQRLAAVATGANQTRAAPAKSRDAA